LELSGPASKEVWGYYFQSHPVDSKRQRDQDLGHAGHVALVGGVLLYQTDIQAKPLPKSEQEILTAAGKALPGAQAGEASWGTNEFSGYFGWVIYVALV